ncbi:MAG: hypothetical protein JNL60_03460 [Bacteroidia bacterium]|nr:hypothetical protein [Bacteroidia bacterium]
MTTIAKSFEQAQSVKTTANVSRYEAFIKKMDFNYYGLISMAILVGSCLGGITAMKIFENDAPFWQFGLGLSISMANLVASISQAPTRWVVNLFGASLIINAILLLVNLI